MGYLLFDIAILLLLALGLGILIAWFIWGRDRSAWGQTYEAAERTEE